MLYYGMSRFLLSLNTANDRKSDFGMTKKSITSLATYLNHNELTTVRTITTNTFGNFTNMRGTYKSYITIN